MPPTGMRQNHKVWIVIPIWETWSRRQSLAPAASFDLGQCYEVLEVRCSTVPVWRSTRYRMKHGIVSASRPRNSTVECLPSSICEDLRTDLARWALGVECWGILPFFTLDSIHCHPMVCSRPEWREISRGLIAKPCPEWARRKSTYGPRILYFIICSSFLVILHFKSPAYMV